RLMLYYSGRYRNANVSFCKPMRMTWKVEYRQILLLKALNQTQQNLLVKMVGHPLLIYLLQARTGYLALGKTSKISLEFRV
ncbi:hypothetical protein M378DRAFT_155951, partial [Amanita muscaria Koide BX008]